jgi:2,4-dienoyl-CoA reductase-like NADH-dependent reductase (Old Yellow Enzyme family)
LKPVASETIRKIFTDKIIAAGGFEPDTAEAIIAKGDADLVSFGRHFIANPDLPKRIRLDCDSIRMTAGRSMGAKRAGTPIIRSIKNQPQWPRHLERRSVRHDRTEN